MDVQLNLINETTDFYNGQVVFFQKNEAAANTEMPVAWTVVVVEYAQYPWMYAFVFPANMYVGASDSWGNYTPILPASDGELFSMQQTSSGDMLVYEGAASSSTQVQVQNNLPTGNIEAGIYKSGKLLVLQSAVLPGQNAVFELKPVLCVSVASKVEQGQVMNASSLTGTTTELPLLGVQSADIIMTGTSGKYSFDMVNVVMA